MSTVGPSLAGTASAGAGWSNPNNAKSSTDAGASATVLTLGSGLETAKLLLTNFGFAIPVGSTITNVKVDVGYNGAPIPYLYAQILLKIYLTKDGGGSYGGTPQSGPVSAAMTASVNHANFGLTLTAAEVNASNFGVGFAILNTPQDANPPPPAGETYYLDYATVTVTYTAPPPVLTAAVIGSGTPEGAGIQLATEAIFRSVIIR